MKDQINLIIKYLRSLISQSKYRSQQFKRIESTFVSFTSESNLSISSKCHCNFCKSCIPQQQQAVLQYQADICEHCVKTVDWTSSMLSNRQITYGRSDSQGEYHISVSKHTLWSPLNPVFSQNRLDSDSELSRVRKQVTWVKSRLTYQWS